MELVAIELESLPCTVLRNAAAKESCGFDMTGAEYNKYRLVVLDRSSWTP